MLIILTHLLLLGSVVSDDSFLLGLHPIALEQDFSPCAGREFGLYSQECGPSILFCQQSQQHFTAMCPFGTWFDENKQECVLPSEVTGCDSSENGELVNALALQAIPREACNGLDDGFHSVSACSSSFIRCTEGLPSLFECPGGMAYSEEQEACIGMENIEECQNLSFGTEFRTEHDCSEDGIMVSGKCSPVFISCSNGISHVMSCPPTLVFDGIIQACEFPANVRECQSSALPADCAEDGLYSFKNCSDRFMACTNGRAITMNCPSELAFDETRQLCDYPLAVAECRDNEGSGEESSGEESSGEESSGEESSGEESSGEESSGEESSGEESSGEESSGEESSGEESSGEEVSGESSGEEGSGEGSGEEGSGEEGSGEGSGEEGSGEGSGEAVNKEDRFKPIPFTPFFFDEPKIESSGVLGDDYEEEASKDFESEALFDQSSGLEAENSGTEGSGIDGSGIEGSGSEGSGEYYEESSGVYGIETLEGSGLSEDEKRNTFISSLKQIGPETSITLCKNRDDGFYSLGCSSLLLSCRNHFARLLACPYNLIYDEHKGYCESASNINECLHKKTNHVYEIAVTASPTTPSYGFEDSLNRLCSSSYDGRISLGCQQEYLICISGQALKSSCSKGETLEEPSQKCVVMSQHSICSREVLEVAALTGESSVYESIEKEQEMEKVLLNEDKKILQSSSLSLANLRGSFPCKEEGSFSRTPCSSNFFYCSEGLGLTLHCDTGMLFSNELNRCVAASDLVECSAGNINNY